MPNSIKYSLSNQTQSLKKGNYWIGVGDVGKGPTSITDYWNGIIPPSGGYVIYGYKGNNGPSINIAYDDDDLVSKTNINNGLNLTSATQALAWYATQSNTMVLNRDYEQIITDSLILNFDAGFIPSYPKSGNTLYDLCSFGNNGTMQNGPVYSDSMGGSIIFDGVDDVVNLLSPLVETSWTLSTWFKFNVEKVKTSQYAFFTTNSVGTRVGRTLLEFTYNFTLLSIAIDSSGNIFAGGRFTEYNGNDIELIVKLDSSGNFISTFNSGLVMSQTQDATDLEIDSSGFLYYCGYNIGNLTKINSTTGTQIQRISGVNASITHANMILDETNDKVYIAGWFTSIQGVSAQRIARLTLSTMTIDTSFNTTTGFVNTEDVQMMALQTDGKLVVGGSFTSYKSQSYNRIIRLNSDASIDTSFIVGSGFNNSILRNCIALQSDGKIVIGGDFTSYNGTTSNRIIRLNTDGSIDNTFSIGSGFNDRVASIIIQSNGKIIVGGNFTSYNGVSSLRIIRLNSDGSKDTGFSSGGFGSGAILSLKLQSDGKILCGLSVTTTYNGTSVNELCRLNSDGTLDNTFNTGTGFIGAYRLNNQTTYLQTSSTYNTNFFYSITSPFAYSWVNFDTASSILSEFNNFTITKDELGNYKQYWNGVLRNTSSIAQFFDLGININRIGTIKGSLGDLLIYNKNLNSSEILQLYQSQLPRFRGEDIVSSGLVLYLDAGSNISYPKTGTTWGDVSGYARNATLTNGPTFNSDNNGSILFDGVDDYVEISSYTTQLKNLSTGTIEMWVKLSSTMTSCTPFYFGADINNRFELVFGDRGSAVNESAGIIVSEGGVFTLVFFVYKGSSSFYFDNQWHQFVYTSGTEGNSFYVDGVKETVGYSNGDASTQKFFSSIPSATTANIGRRILSGAASQLMKGYNSINRIYDRSLSESEVLQNYNAQKTRFGL